MPDYYIRSCDYQHGDFEYLIMTDETPEKAAEKHFKDETARSESNELWVLTIEVYESESAQESGAKPLFEKKYDILAK